MPQGKKCFAPASLFIRFVGIPYACWARKGPLSQSGPFAYFMSARVIP